MSSIKSDPILKFTENGYESILKLYNLDAKRMDESVDILQKWINSQNHFNKKNFNREYLEATIISCKGLMERAKSRIDKYCTMRTLMPKYFEKTHAINDFEVMNQTFKTAFLPVETKDYYRVCIMQVKEKGFCSSVIMDCYKFVVLILEYMKVHDYFHGTIFIIDYRDVNLTTVLTSLNPVDLASATKLFMDGFGLRIRGIHIITSSKLVEAVVSILKGALSEKVGGRIQVHNSVDSLHEVLPKDMLPADYGGLEKPYDELCDDLLNALTSKENLDYLEEMKSATTNEACRMTTEFNSLYLGTPGTFRTLVVD